MRYGKTPAGRVTLHGSMLFEGAGTWVDGGCVEGLWLRHHRDAAPVGQRMVRAEAGKGLSEDCSAIELSPRQVLLASAETYGRMSLPPATLRENLTVSADLSEWRSGSMVAIGRKVLLRLTFPCDPCSRLNRHRPGLMRRIGRERGVLARVVRSGMIRLGDRVRLRPGVFAAWSERWQERVREVARMVPDGAVVQNAQLALLAGVPLSYCRVFSRVLADSPDRLQRRAASRDERADAPRWSGADVFDDEGGMGTYASEVIREAGYTNG